MHNAKAIQIIGFIQELDKVKEMIIDVNKDIPKSNSQLIDVRICNEEAIRSITTSIDELSKELAEVI